MSALYGVIGDPVSHSLSPLIHNGWLRQEGRNASYIAMHVPKGELADALSALQLRGCKGLNITLPHKSDALELAENASKAAQIIGAANTLSRTEAGNWHAENTDAAGFEFALKERGINPAGMQICLIGAGGAARAIIYALDRAGAKITVCNRTVSRAESVLSDFPGAQHKAQPLEALSEALHSADMLINTASLGHTGAALLLPDGGGRAFMDISYGKVAAPLLNTAKLAGWSVSDGLEMLVAQAALSYQHWFGVLPDTGSALDRCRMALEASV